VNQNKNTEQRSDISDIRARAANWAKQITRPEAIIDRASDFLNTLAFYHYNVNTGAMTYVYYRTRMEVDSMITARFESEPTSHEFITNFPINNPETPTPIEIDTEQDEVA